VKLIARLWSAGVARCSVDLPMMQASCDLCEFDGVPSLYCYVELPMQARIADFRRVARFRQIAYARLCSSVLFFSA
jgi:hypothetical protein